MVKWLLIIFLTQIVVKEACSGRSQFDGPTHVTDIDKTEENKQLIANFMRGGSLGKHLKRLLNTSALSNMLMIKDGLEGLNEVITYLISQNNMFDYRVVHHILDEGNFLLA